MCSGLPVVMETGSGIHVEWTTSSHGNVIRTACGVVMET